MEDIYLGDFEGFVGRRDALAKELRAQGDSEAAGRIKALKKPSRGAWAVNQLAGREPKLREELLASANDLRDAHESVLTGEGDHADLREAAEKERAAVAKALAKAEAIAAGAGARLSPAMLERVRKTLHAVALDETVREQFEESRLTTEHEASGLGGLSASAPSYTPKRRKAPSRKDEKREAAQRLRAERKAADAELGRLERRRQDAEREVQAARKAAARAQRDLERASGELEKATGEAAEAKRRAEELHGRSE